MTRLTRWGIAAVLAAVTVVSEAVLKFHVTALVREVTGGPCKYTGRAIPATSQQ